MLLNRFWAAIHCKIAAFWHPALPDRHGLIGRIGFDNSGDCEENR